MANKMEIDLGDIVFTLTFNTFDAYTVSPLGCHAGTLGNVTSSYKMKGDKPGFLQTERVLEIFKEQDLYQKVMDKMISGCKHAFGGWSMGNGSTWHNKGHWIISAPWKKPDYSLGLFYTPELMELIAYFCDKDPAKYGHYVMTPPTDCGAHDNNAGFPATRTMVWMPPHVSVNPNTLTTRVTGRMGKPEPKQAVAPKAEPKKPLTRPDRRKYLETKRQPKYGPKYVQYPWRKAA